MFINKFELDNSKKYLKNGYLIQKAENFKALDLVRNILVKAIGEQIKNNHFKNCDELLNNIHKLVPIKNLNSFRLNVIQKINKSKQLRPNIFLTAQKLIEAIVGNELAMQLRTNLSIQMPKDKSSLLPLHADTWSGVSPFEVVLWLPLVDCSKTKSMFILPHNKLKKYKNLFSVKKKNKNTTDIFKKIRKDLIWLNVKYGDIVLFNQSLPHGNIINQEKETRWSMNIRFKGLFTPYGDKKIGEFFEPITTKTASKFGMNYKLPKI